MLRRLAVVTFVSMLVPGSALAAAPPKLVVDSAHGQPDAGKPALWTGTVLSDGARIRNVPECRTVACGHLKLQVKLPRHLFGDKPGGVHVAIRFIEGTPDDNLALAVYRHHRPIGASTAQVATAQSVLIPAARNGSYDLYVVDGISFGLPEPSPSISYEGLAQVVY